MIATAAPRSYVRDWSSKAGDRGYSLGEGSATIAATFGVGMEAERSRGALGHGEERTLGIVAAILGALPVGSGQHRVVRPIFSRRLSGLPPTPRRARLRGGGRFDLDLSDYTQAQAFLTRRYDPALLRFVLSRLGDDTTLVDVGAHIGLTTVPVALARRRTRILALEPHPQNFRRLRDHVALNGCRNVEVERMAAGAEPGVAVLSSEGEGSDYHRVIGPADHGYGPTPADGTVEVEMTSIDELADRRGIERIDLLKLDVEGHEARVFDGAERMLSAGRIGAAICELNDELLAAGGSSSADLERRLRGYGMERIVIPRVGLHRIHEPSVAYENFAFVPVGEAA